MKVISLEGIGGSGKSTLANLIVEKYVTEGRRVLLYKPVSRQRLQDILTPFSGERENVWVCNLPVLSPKAEMLCYLALLIQDNLRFIESQYDLIVLDRYIDTISATVFARNNILDRELDFRIFYIWIKSVCYKEIRIPDKTLVLITDPIVAEQRTIKRESKNYTESDKVLFSKISEFYNLVAEREPNRFCYIDANGTTDEVFGKATTVLDHTLF